MLFRTLRAELLRQSVTREDLADLLGCSKATLSADFTGKRSFSMQDVYIIMDKLNLPCQHDQRSLLFAQDFTP